MGRNFRRGLLALGGLLAMMSGAVEPRSDEQLLDAIEELSLRAADAPEALQRLQRAGVDEDTVDAWLAQLQAACLENPSHCQTIGAGASRTGAVTDQLIALLAKVGTEHSVSLLERLDARGAFHASLALRSIAAREATRSHGTPCAPPSVEEVRRAEARLVGFPVLSYERQQLVARLPTAAELSDLAYFVVAAELGGPTRPARGVEDERSSDAGVRSGTGAREDEQTMNFIVRAEATHHCRSAVTARMLRLSVRETSGPGVADLFGVTPLARAGFDVARLYRGALLTVNQGVPDEQVRAAVNRAPPAVRPPMQAHLERWGHPDWEFETRAVEGWADLRGRAAFPRLLELASSASLRVRLRTLKALAQLVRESHECGVSCGGWRVVGTVGWSEAASVRALDEHCAEALTETERGELTRALLPLASDASEELRAALTQVLGALGAPSARDTLVGLDCAACGTRVSSAARDAVVQLDEAVARRACEQRFLEAHPDAAGGHFVTPASQRVAVPPLLQGLLQPGQRDAAFCALVASGKHRPGSLPDAPKWACEVNHVLVAPQAQGGAAVVVFPAASWAQYAGPGKPKGPMVVFDAEGFQLPLLHDDLDPEADVFSYRGDEALAFGLTLRFTGGKTLSVVPVGPSTLPVLSVELSGEDWSWRVTSDGPKRPPRIEVGAQVDLARNAPTAIYRWVPAQRRYEGPAGGPTQGFRRLRDEVSTCPASTP
jgi:hypothetical protein